MTTTSPTATMKLVTRDGLLAGQKQSLALEITTTGFQSLLIAVPVGNSGDALMEQDAWANCALKIQNRRAKPEKRTDQKTPGRRFVYVPLSAVETKSELTFQLLFSEFLVAKDVGPTRIELYGDKIAEPSLCNIDILKSDREPRIMSFTANSYSLIQGSVPELGWEIDMDCSYELVLAERPKEQLATGSGVSGKKEVDATGVYVLNLLQGQTIVDTRSLMIHSYKQTSFESYALDFLGRGSAEVLGLHAHPENGRLYALLRFGAKSEEAELWSTTNGFASNKAYWKMETNNQGQAIRIPRDAARRPGAILWDKLFLLGGDCCHPDKPGTAVGYYDFQANVWWQIEDDKDSSFWPEGMSERMGHAVVAVAAKGGAKGAIWVMGGWTQNGGLCNDIWTFDGETWAQLHCDGTPVPCNICLFGAVATKESVWAFGGFKSPGGAADPAQFLRFDRAGKVSPVNPEMSGQYCASALFPFDDATDLPCGIGTFFKAGGAYVDRTFFAALERGVYSFTKYDTTLDAEGVFQHLDYYSIHATVHQRAVFFRTLKPNDTQTSSKIHYLVRVEAKK